jgi:hypothetical protein
MSKLRSKKAIGFAEQMPISCVEWWEFSAAERSCETIGKDFEK